MGYLVVSEVVGGVFAAGYVVLGFIAWRRRQAHRRPHVN